MTDKTTMQIAMKLKQVRLKKNLTQLDLAEKAGVSVNNYAKIERGEIRPSVKTLEKVIKALGIESSSIFPF